MKITLTALLFLFGTVSPASASQGTLCSPINYCRVEKKTWAKKGWISNNVKETQFSSFCETDRPALQLESELGLELWFHSGDKASKSWLEAQPHVTANLHTYKLTHVVASGSAPMNETAIVFSHRLTPKGPTFVEVACFKK